MKNMGNESENTDFKNITPNKPSAKPPTATTRKNSIN